MQPFSGEKPDIDCIMAVMVNLIFLRGQSEKESVDFGVLQNHSPPPPKGECLQCASVTLHHPAGSWRGDMEGERG